MVSRGHKLHDLMHEYPLSTLRGMMAASQYNRKTDLVTSTQSHAIAILNGLDAGFNKGKQKFLKKYVDKILKTIERKNVKSKDDPGDQNKLLSAFGLKAPTDGSRPS